MATELLLREANQEVQALRSDLYAQRRTAEERRVALQTLTAERTALQTQVASLTTELASCRQEVDALRGVEQELGSLRSSLAKVQQEAELGLRARRILESELSSERLARQALEDAKASLEAERARLQKAKDDLSAALRVAQKKAIDAEEEQVRAEEEAAALRVEVQALQAGSPRGTSIPLDDGWSSKSTLQEQLQQERQRTEAVLQQLQALQHQHQHVQADAQQLRAQCAQLQVDLSTSQAQLASVQADLQALRSSYDSTGNASDPAAGSINAAQASPAQSPLSHAQPAGPHAVPGASMSCNGHAGYDTTAFPHVDDCAGPAAALHHHQQSHIQASAPAVSNGAGPPEDMLDHLQHQVQRLKASRDKLLEQVDRQWEEMDRLGAEHKAAQEEVATLRLLAGAWEGAAQDGLRQVERLKEMLEEAASWGPDSAGPGPGASRPGESASARAVAAMPKSSTNGSASSSSAQHGAVGVKQGDSAPSDAVAGIQGTSGMEALEAALLRERARCADLDLQLRALAAELLRAQHASMALGRSMLPVLTGFEHRLQDMGVRALQAHAQVGAFQLPGSHSSETASMLMPRLQAAH